MPPGLRGHRGGIASLGQFVLANWTTLEADFTHLYNEDLAEAVWGQERPRSFRWLEVHVLNLPNESETARAFGAYKPGDWTNADELAMGLFNEAQLTNYILLVANSAKGTSIPKPTMIRRPGGVPEQNRPKVATAEELATALRMGPGIVDYTPKATE